MKMTKGAALAVLFTVGAVLLYSTGILERPKQESDGHQGLQGPWSLFSSDALTVSVQPGMAVKAKVSTGPSSAGAGSIEMAGLLINYSENMPSSATTFTRYHHEHGPYPIAYQFVSACARHANEFYVCGFTQDGDAVVERWEISPEQGGYNTVRELSGSHVGTPAPLSGVNLAIRGMFQPPEERIHEPPVRTTLYQGPDLREIRSMAVDPEGRFLLILADHKIFRIEDIQFTPTVVLVHDSDQIPELEYVSRVSVMLHATEGRIYRLYSNREAPSLVDVVLRDPDNDGLFDTWDVLTREEYQSAYGDPSVWLDDYRFYKFREGG